MCTNYYDIIKCMFRYLKVRMHKVFSLRSKCFCLNILCKLLSVLVAPNNGRACDWITLVMCRDLIDVFIQDQVPPSTSRHFGCVPPEYAVQCQSFLCWWDAYLSEIGRSTWPSLETTKLYEEWADEDFRRSCLTDAERPNKSRRERIQVRYFLRATDRMRATVSSGSRI